MKQGLLLLRSAVTLVAQPRVRMVEDVRKVLAVMGVQEAGARALPNTRIAG